MITGGRRTHTSRAVTLFPLWQAGVQIHLLANVLETVAALARRRPDAAEDLLALVAAHLRDLLGLARPLVPLAEEIRMILVCVGLERARMGGRLRLEVACAQAALSAMVPPLLLQPLVENAVRHGISRRPGGGRIRISARVADGLLLLAVTDDGPGIRRQPSAGLRAGQGLISVRCRLAALWGSDARLRILALPGCGTVAAISAPVLVPAQRPLGGLS
ncbi:MAG: histidine kinase [Armatimonadetes bacterium]|nr:histidine kinase [Armatimonadota bacterium]